MSYLAYNGITEVLYLINEFRTCCDKSLEEVDANIVACFVNVFKDEHKQRKELDSGQNQSPNQ